MMGRLEQLSFGAVERVKCARRRIDTECGRRRTEAR
jgi:hypothetical protein